MSDLDNYTPFGEEWKKEMMKWRKEDLVNFIRKLQSGTDDEKISLIQSIDDAQITCEGIINDFESGIIDKDEANKLLGEYTARIMEIFWDNALPKAKEELINKFDDNFLLMIHGAAKHNPVQEFKTFVKTELKNNF